MAILCGIFCIFNTAGEPGTVSYFLGVPWM